MSPRAAWRLESLGFGEIYDYVGSKMEWIGAGLPWEGSEASQPKLGDLANPNVLLCALDDTVGAVRAGLGQRPICLAVNDERIVLGLLRAEALGPDDDRAGLRGHAGRPQYLPAPCSGYRDGRAARRTS